jgi:hypothetical protein
MTEKKEFTNENLLKLRRARQMALAIIKRGREAGIPEKYLRLPPSSFVSVLDPDFHHGPVRGVTDFTDKIYKQPDFLMNREFIAIDGGDDASRFKAAYAILFRIIAYDKRGQFFGCESLMHKFQTINSTENITRNDLAEELKSYDILMIGEFNKMGFSPHFETGSFFDEVLSDRIAKARPTIITFTSPISSETPTQENLEKMAAQGKLDTGCGRILHRLTLTSETTESVLRVRVKSI